MVTYKTVFYSHCVNEFEIYNGIVIGEWLRKRVNVGYKACELTCRVDNLVYRLAS